MTDEKPAPCEHCWIVAGTAIEYFLDESILCQYRDAWDPEAKGEAITEILKRSDLDPSKYTAPPIETDQLCEKLLDAAMEASGAASAADEDETLKKGTFHFVVKYYKTMLQAMKDKARELIPFADPPASPPMGGPSLPIPKDTLDALAHTSIYLRWATTHLELAFRKLGVPTSETHTPET